MGRLPAFLRRGDVRANSTAAILFMVAGSTILLGIITAEALFPGDYSTSEHSVSTLASTFEPGGDVREPSATIFNLTMTVTGLMIASGAFLLSGHGWAMPIALGVLGIAVFLVGIFPGEVVDGEPSTEGVHPIVALLAFLGGAAAALLAARVTRAPFRYLSAVFGLICLSALFSSGALGDTKLGEGGVERWVIYPVVLWLLALGGYLLGERSSHPEPREELPG
jgi:hypothetical membrane protein